MRALRAFCAAAERGSFRLAADELFLTASAVSHQIKQLESVLGVRLFSRGHRSLKLTDTGRTLHDDLVPIFEELDLAIERNGRQAGRAVLRLSVQPFFASELLMPRLSTFLDEHPEISVTVDATEIEPGTLDKSADVSVRLFSSPPTNVNSELLFALQLTPVGSPNFYDSIKVVAGRITSDFPLIVHDARPKAWQQWQRSSGIRLPSNAKTIRLNSMISVARAAEEGLGAALMPSQLCTAWFHSGALIPLFDHELHSPEAYYLICENDRTVSEHVNTFREWVLQEFAGQDDFFSAPRTN